MDYDTIQALSNTILRWRMRRSELLFNTVSFANLREITSHMRILIACVFATSIRIEETNAMPLQLDPVKKLDEALLDLRLPLAKSYV
jgi:hypothetical protein